MSLLSIYSWNVNGIRAIAKKGFFNWVKQVNPDVFCLQETKADENQLTFDIKLIEGYESYFASATTKKGYSGVATYTKIKPLHIHYGMGISKFDQEGRIINTEFEQFHLLNVYFPNGKASPQRLEYKMEFYKAFLDYCKTLLQTGKHVVFCGDVNTAHKEIDLARPKENENISGFLKIERKWVDEVLEHGFVDTFRMFNQSPNQYSWWSQRGGARSRNVGWRIDYFFANKKLTPHIKGASIDQSVLGSDHCPISITLDL